jgi:hypothetical protein
MPPLFRLFLSAPVRRTLGLGWFGLAAGTCAVALPAPNEWKDVKGVTFKGEPMGTAGPVALFRTGGT